MNKLGYTYISVAFVICCLWLFMVFVPYHKQKQILSIKIDNSKKQLEDYKQTIKSFPAFLKRKNHLDLLKSNLNSKLYTKNDVLKLFKQIKKEASFQKLTVIDITPSIEELLYLNNIIPNSGQPPFINIGLQLKGDYIHFGKFISSIEKKEFFQNINQCHIIKGDESDKNGVINIYFTFKALLGNLPGDA